MVQSRYSSRAAASSSGRMKASTKDNMGLPDWKSVFALGERICSGQFGMRAKRTSVASLQGTFGGCLNVADLMFNCLVHSLEDILVPEGSRKHRAVQRRAVAYCSTGLMIFAAPNGTLSFVLDVVDGIAVVLAFPECVAEGFSF